MRAIFWHGTGETAALRYRLLEAVFAEAGIPLERAMTLEEVVAAAMRSRRAGDYDLVVIDCYQDEPSDRAIAAMSKSFGPIGVPRVARSARISPYTWATSSSNGSDTYGSRNACCIAWVRAGCALFAAP